MASPLSNKEKYVSLVTFRRDGRSVATPVWFAAIGDEFGVITETNVGKVKRIRNNSRVTVQVCDYSGNVVPAGDPKAAPVLEATARLVTGADAVAVRKAIAKKYGLTYAGLRCTGTSPAFSGVCAASATTQPRLRFSSSCRQATNSRRAQRVLYGRATAMTSTRSVIESR